MQPIIFIVGPTATGKSEVAYELAKRLDSEIVSCDSMLIYEGMPILTARPSRAVLDGVVHHCIGYVPPNECYNVFQYCTRATAVITSLLEKKKTPIVAGGTGLYVKALCDGIFEGSKADEAVRSELVREAERAGTKPLYERLRTLDPEAASKISVNDQRRIVRALEVVMTSGVPISKKQKEARGLCATHAVKLFGLTCAREKLYGRINRRTDEMFANGALEEFERIVSAGISRTASSIIGIAEIGAYRNGTMSLEAARELMKKNTRNFAKRQLTWFRRDKRIEWVDVEGRTAREIADGIYTRCV